MFTEHSAPMGPVVGTKATAQTYRYALNYLLKYFVTPLSAERNNYNNYPKLFAHPF
jgi:hypothetical protein